MNKRNKALVILSVPFALGCVLGFLFGILVGGGCSGKEDYDKGAELAAIIEETASQDASDEMEASEGTAEESSDDVDGMGKPKAREIIYYASRLPYAKMFADLNPVHLETGRRLGLKSAPKTRDDVKSLKGLVRIEDNEYYVVDELQYSVPYLTKGAAKELLAIAKAFSDSLESKQLLDYKLIVTSVLRTEEDVERLRRSGNPNASDNSSHCYGTTFDITYTRYFSKDETEAFMQPFELTKVLGEVLRDQKKASRCIVKYEKKEHCFHITSCLPS